MVDWKDAVFYLLMVSIVVWFILKVIGIIQSPLYFELYPFFAIAFGGGIAYEKINSTLKNINQKLNELKNVPERLTKIETRCEINHKTS